MGGFGIVLDNNCTLKNRFVDIQHDPGSFGDIQAISDGIKKIHSVFEPG